jgi:hypothetical protein
MNSAAETWPVLPRFPVYAGIGPRYRAALAERDEARAERNRAEVALALVSGALLDAGMAVGEEMEFGNVVRRLAAERDAALALVNAPLEVVP